MSIHTQIPKRTKIVLSITIAAVLCAAVVSAFLTFGNIKIPDLIVTAENGAALQAIRGGYDWRTGFNMVQADSVSPVDFEYMAENILTIRNGNSLILSNKNNVFDVQDFKLVSLFENSQKETGYGVSQGGFKNGNLIITAPYVSGEYIYSIRLQFRRGTVEYGFKVIVTENDGASIDSSGEMSTTNPFDAEFFFPLARHTHTFSFDGSAFTPANDFMILNTYVSGLDETVYFKVDDLCAYARDLSGLTNEQINMIETYENTKTSGWHRYINLIDLRGLGIYTDVGWELSSHTPVDFYTSEPDVTNAY